MDTPDDEEKIGLNLMPIGDIGKLAIALMFLFLFVVLMFFPSVFAQFLKPPHEAQQPTAVGCKISVTILAKPGN